MKVRRTLLLHVVNYERHFVPTIISKLIEQLHVKNQKRFKMQNGGDTLEHHDKSALTNRL